MGKYDGWASRHASRSGHTPADPAERGQPGPAPAQPQTVLPPPPPGWTYALMNGQMVLVQLSALGQPPAPAPAPPPAFAAPPRQPGQGAVVPYVQAPHYTPVSAPGQPPAISMPIRSSILVKPGDRDPYAELMATVPDLVPPGGTQDGPQGRPSVQTLQELGALPEFQAAHIGDQTAYPRGAPTGKVAELGSVALPDLPAEPAAAAPPAVVHVPPPPLNIPEPEAPVSTRPTNGRVH